MATLTTVAVAGNPAVIKGLSSGSSLSGTKVTFRPTRRSSSVSSKGRVVAKYGDKNVYFDLEDLPNTTGQWDLYGSDAAAPYNSLQDVKDIVLVKVNMADNPVDMLTKPMLVAKFCNCLDLLGLMPR